MARSGRGFLVGLALQRRDGRKAIPGQQILFRVDHLPDAADNPETRSRGLVMHRDIADGVEPMRDAPSVLSVEKPVLDVQMFCAARRLDDLIDGDRIRIAELVEQVLQLALLGGAVGVDDGPERLGSSCLSVGDRYRLNVVTPLRSIRSPSMTTGFR